MHGERTASCRPRAVARFAALPAALGRVPRHNARVAAHRGRDPVPGVQADALFVGCGSRRSGPDRPGARRIAVRRLDRRRRRPAPVAPRHADLAGCLQRRARFELVRRARGTLALVRPERARVGRRQHRRPDAIRGDRHLGGTSAVRERERTLAAALPSGPGGRTGYRGTASRPVRYGLGLLDRRGHLRNLAACGCQPSRPQAAGRRDTLRAALDRRRACDS